MYNRKIKIKINIFDLFIKKNPCQGASFYFSPFSFETQNRKAGFLFRFSYFSSKPNLEITTMTEKSIGVTIKISPTLNRLVIE